MKRFFLAAALIFITLSRSYAAEPRYTKQTLNLPGRIVNLAVEDMDGDGLKDILAVCLYKPKGKPPERCLSVFYQRKGTGFRPSPDESWVLDPEAVVYDIGDVQRNGKKAIVYMRPDGLYAYLPNNHKYNFRPVLLVKAQDAIFNHPDPLDLPRWPLVLEGNGRSTVGGGKNEGFLLVPGITRLFVYQAAPGYRPAGSVPLTIRTTFSEDVMDPGRLTVSNKVPNVSAVPFTSRSMQDLFITWEDSADVYSRKRSGFSGYPSVRFRPGLMKVNKEMINNAVVRPIDLKGNGTYDFVVTKMTGGISQARSLVFIYERTPGGGFPAKPTQTIVTEGVIGPEFLDMNGDGRLDMLLPTVKMGISNIINMVTSKEVKMTLGIYLQDKDGRFPDRPTKEKLISFQLDLSHIGKNPKPVMAFGKFAKGPGYGLAVAAKEDRVSIYMPDRYSLLTDFPSLNFEVPAPTELKAIDLNGDGIDDLVMSYKENKAESKTINVFLSK
ncbi:MAG: hypothetical protein ACYDFU_10090 [Nitrospirota bacterium]